MAYRGYLALNGSEIANSSRVSAHMGKQTPTTDTGVFYDDGLYPDYDTYPGDEDYPGTPSTACEFTEIYPGLWAAPDDSGSEEVYPGLWTPPNGSKQWDEGLAYHDGTCWGPATACGRCNSAVITYDDSWPGLNEFLSDNVYRPELSPWYSVQTPESAEFVGVWVMKIDGLGGTPIDRPVAPAIGPGSIIGPNRDAGRTITVEALLIACSNAGVEFGLNWLTCKLRATTPDTLSTLRYLQAHPQYSAVDVESLVREIHGVVMTQEPRVVDEVNTEGREHQQATLYRVSWTMATASPYAYMPAVDMHVDWDEVTRQPINWIHAAECSKPETCQDMPLLFSATCVPEEIDLVNTPPPVCGGCVPVSGIDKYSFRVPTMEYPFGCQDTAVSMTITNTGDTDLTLRAFWRECGADVRCDDEYWPLQVNALPPSASLILDAVSAKYWAYYDERVRMPRGIVSTPNGGPWRPPVIDRRVCLDFIVQTASTSEFTVDFTLADRAA